MNAAIDSRVRNALGLVQEEDWEPAINTDGTIRCDAYAVELTDLVDLTNWGDGIRLICRRERPHQGAQLTVFDTLEGWRHTCHITNTAGHSLAVAPPTIDSAPDLHLADPAPVA